MKTTTTDIEAILSGSPVPIEVEYPLGDQPEGFTWFVKQPDDWLLDMAYAVKDAAYAQVMALPEMQSAKDLPVDGEWARVQNTAIKTAKDRIAELEAIAEREPEQELELLNLQDRIKNLADPESFNKAMQIANGTANNAFYKWLLPRSVVDKSGKVVCDVNTQVGRKRWQSLGKDVRDELLEPLVYVVDLVGKAKNSKASQPST